MKLLLTLLLIPLLALAEDNPRRGTNWSDAAIPTAEALNRYAERKLYEELKRLIQIGQHARYAERRVALIDYPLYPYLEYTYHAYRLSRLKPEQLREFAENWPDTPLPRLLRGSWLRYLGIRGNWPMLAQHYDPSHSNDTLACQYANSLYRTGQIEAAHSATARLWLSGTSQPDACDAPFKLWRDAGQLSSAMAWERFALALEANQYKLASYLVRFLHKDKRGLANRFREVHQRPTRIRSFKRYAADGEQERRMILHALRRLARKDAPAAYNALRTYEKSHAFTAAELRDTYVYVGKRLALDFAGEALIYDVPIDDETDTGLIEARLRYALRQQDWSEVLVSLHRLPQAKADSNRWRYWRARALLESEENADRASGIGVLAELAQLRSFYGFLAADLLNQPYEFGHEPKNFAADEIERVRLLPGIQRAFELLATDSPVHARRQWQHTTLSLTPRQQEIAAHTARSWGWHERAIRSMIDAEAWNDLEVRFPLAYREAFTYHSTRENIPLSWAFAVTRQESAFMADARSSSGAGGLMQLMPATAKLVAGKIGLKLVAKTQVNQPETNIRLGTTYLGQMLRRFDNNRIVASAAYNAGPARAARWYDASVPLDIWIETMPFSETRDYVQNVAVFAAIYAERMGEQQPLIYAHEYSGFAPGSPPTLRQQTTQAK